MEKTVNRWLAALIGALILWICKEVYQLRIEVAEMRVDLSRIVKSHETKTVSRE